MTGVNLYTAPRTVAGYSSAEAARAAGVSYRQLDYWTRERIVRPSVAEAGGSGTARRWSLADVEVLRTLGALSALGCAGDALRHAGRVLAEAVEVGRWVIVGPAGEVELVNDSLDLALALEEAPASWVVKLGAA